MNTVQSAQDLRYKNDAKLKELKLKKEHQINRIFYFTFEIIGYFLGPALLAVWLGKNTSRTTTIIVLVIAFVLGWLVVLLRYNQIKRKTQALEDKINARKAELDNESNS